MLARLAQRRRRPVADEAIHIVALWNLMIVLIPFLLLSAVFSQTSILNLYLPPPPKAKGAGALPSAAKPVVSIVRDGYVLSDGPTIVAAIPLDGSGGYNTRQLNELLVAIKRDLPDGSDITILSEADVSYDTIVRTMDASREAVIEENGRPVARPLFPIISLGQIGPRSSQPMGARR